MNTQQEIEQLKKEIEFLLTKKTTRFYKDKDKHGNIIHVGQIWLKDFLLGEIIVDSRCYVISSWVSEKHRNQGLGTKLYRKALKELGKLGTWGCTEPAMAIWKKLEKRHTRIDKRMLRHK